MQAGIAAWRALYHPEWYNLHIVLGLTLPTLITRVFTLIVALSFHEFSHAWAADRLGDTTPRASGRLTLNPIAHLDVFGSLMLIVAGFGWAKPVPVNPYALRRRHPAGLMLVSVAGPLSNLLLAIIAAIPFQAGLVSWTPSSALLPSIGSFLAEFIFINLILFFFNLLPIFPLDGEKVLEYFLPPSAQDTLARLRPYGPMILLALLFVGPMIGFDILHWLVGTPAQRIFQLLV